jgi:cysteinyl-tRNA synthetase
MRVCRSVLWLFSPLRRTTAPNHGSTVAHAYEDSELKLYNSLTRRKEVFTPLSPPTVTWYCCGPTVYDAAHMGHARSYITFDILRRVLSDYFGYRINYVMNITDIDDKIIKRARHTHLLDNYTKNFPSLCNLVHDITAAMQLFTEKVRSETDPVKCGTLQGVMERVTLELQRTREDSDGSSNSDQVSTML